MTDCCRAGGETEDRLCPACRQPGSSVDPITLKALLTPAALERLWPAPHRYCASASCDVVYFGSGRVFARGDVRVPIFHKEPAGFRTVCYCFAVGEREIRLELQATGRSESTDRIRRLVQEGRCACEVRNPQGTCCLGSATALERMGSVWAGRDGRDGASGS